MREQGQPSQLPEGGLRRFIADHPILSFLFNICKSIQNLKKEGKPLRGGVPMWVTDMDGFVEGVERECQEAIDIDQDTISQMQEADIEAAKESKVWEQFRKDTRRRIEDELLRSLDLRARHPISVASSQERMKDRFAGHGPPSMPYASKQAVADILSELGLYLQEKGKDAESRVEQAIEEIQEGAWLEQFFRLQKGQAPKPLPSNPQT
mmetsp:Transcript_40065/g.62549  ORF Transcript_40065/g.62549 Transcript_40065/m.62549 type:complete len:208 (+) Transcript_40065:1-624(+)